MSRKTAFWIAVIMNVLIFNILLWTAAESWIIKIALAGTFVIQGFLIALADRLTN